MRDSHPQIGWQLVQGKQGIVLNMFKIKCELEILSEVLRTKLEMFVLLCDIQVLLLASKHERLTILGKVAIYDIALHNLLFPENHIMEFDPCNNYK